MYNLFALFILAASVEAVWELLKHVWPRCIYRLERERGVPVDRIGVVLLSVVACILANFDLPAAAGISFDLPAAGIILTGVLTGRVSNFWHDLIGVADGIRRDKKPLNLHGGL